ncbi:MAG: hypothetical protein LBG27_01625 [Spirochaetaceae bacterium]|jgi:hypothetical protein|nr:hypothetical protein [Spirochaetaceae bacterium]
MEVVQVRDAGLGLVVYRLRNISQQQANHGFASSGAANEVTILENGSVVYEGSLPATVSVKGSKSYVVQYKDKDGNSRTLQIQKRFSGWFVADILLLGGWIIDLITGNVMVYDKTALLLVSYNDSQTGLFVDHVPSGLQDNLRVIRNIYN